MAARQAAEINVIQIHFKNLILGAGMLQLHRQINFLEFPGQGFLGAQVAQLHQLLGNGAGPLGVIAAFQI